MYNVNMSALLPLMYKLAHMLNLPYYSQSSLNLPYLATDSRFVETDLHLSCYINTPPLHRCDKSFLPKFFPPKFF